MMLMAYTTDSCKDDVIVPVDVGLSPSVNPFQRIEIFLDGLRPPREFS